MGRDDTRCQESSTEVVNRLEHPALRFYNQELCQEPDGPFEVQVTAPIPRDWLGSVALNLWIRGSPPTLRTLTAL